MKREPTYDKPRITSTIIIGILLSIGLILALALVGVSWRDMSGAMTTTSSSSSVDGVGQAVGGAAVAVAYSLVIVMVIGVYIGTLLSGTLCLIFSIFNRHSTSKKVRICSYVFDGLSGALVLLSIIKIILLIAGV